MLLYNTLSEKKEKIERPKNRSLKLFVCGPTVYDESHIGHGRVYVTFDAFVKYLRSEKWKIFYLQNITDVDDKIINRARAEKTDPLKLALKFSKLHNNDMRQLSVTAVNKYALASAFIPQITKQIKTLIKKGYAYEIKNQGWYFDVSKPLDYGKLSKRTALEAEDGVSRIDESVEKRNKGDFCLWKFVKTDPSFKTCLPTGKVKNWKLKISNGEPLWGSPLGLGRPGWHIEDTAISEKFFGPQYDIHGGGLDLKFPHHEAEIAQQESASGKKPFVKIWMHVGLIRVDNQKMSKSLGNFITIKKILESFSPSAFRWWILSHHYRSPIIYTEKNLNQASESIKTAKEFLTRLDFVARKSHVKKTNSATTEIVSKFRKEFQQKLADDFNTPEAIAALFVLINEINKIIWTLTAKEAKNVSNIIISNLKTLGFDLKITPLPKNVAKIAEKRELSRVNKQFIQSDALRKEIEALGYKIEDTPLGAIILP